MRQVAEACCEQEEAAKWRTVAAVAVRNFGIFMGFPTGSRLGSRHAACGMRNVLAARLLLITVINLARQQIEIKRRRLATARSKGYGTAQPQNAIREDRDFVWVTRQAGRQAGRTRNGVGVGGGARVV